jgi:hypothetical protein
MHTYRTKKFSGLRIALVIFFVVYSVAMFLGSIPLEFIPKRLHRSHASLRTGLGYIMLRTDRLFDNQLGKLKPKLICIQVVGTNANGKFQLLYSCYKNCIPPMLRIGENIVELSMKRMIITELYASRDMNDIRRRLRNSQRYAQISSYFCSRNPEMTKLFFILRLSQQHYDTGEIIEDRNAIYCFDCLKRESLRPPNIPLH